MSLRTKVPLYNADIGKRRNGIFRRVSVGRVLFTLSILALCLLSVAYQVNFGGTRVDSQRREQSSEGISNLDYGGERDSELGFSAVSVEGPAREFGEGYTEQTGERGVLSSLTEGDSGFEVGRHNGVTASIDGAHPPGGKGIDTASWPVHTAAQSNTPSVNAAAVLVSKDPSLEETKRTAEAWPIFVYMTKVKPCIALLLNITARFNPDSTIYLLTDAETPPEARVLEQLYQIRVRVLYYNPNPEPGSSVHTFRQHYKHRSLNEEWYEKMCFERFLILEKFALQEGVKRLYYFDADTTFFEDLRNTPYLRHDHDFIGLTHLSSYNALWRIDVLQQFCKYMLWFYQRPVEEFDRDVRRWGDYLVPYNAEPIPGAQKVLQFSDMYLISAFLQTHKFSRILLLYEEEIPLRLPLIAIDHPDGLRSPGDVKSICDSVEHFERYIDWRMTEQGLLAPFYNGTLLTGLQFEGPCKKAVMPHVLQKIFPGTPEDDLQWL